MNIEMKIKIFYFSFKTYKTKWFIQGYTLLFFFLQIHVTSSKSDQGLISYID